MVHLLIALIVFGAALYIVSLLPIDATLKRIIQVIAMVVIAVWALKALLPLAGLG